MVEFKNFENRVYSTQGCSTTARNGFARKRIRKKRQRNSIKKNANIRDA